MRRFQAILGLILISNVCLAAEHASVEANLQKALAGIYDGHDREAEQALAALEANRPGYPASAVYRCLLVYWRAAADPGNTELLDRFRRLSNEAIRLSTEWTEAHPNDPEGWRFLASALGQRSQFAITVAPSKAEIVRFGLKARNAVIKAYEMDKSDKDILMGIGATNYFTAKIPVFVRPVAMMMGVHGGNRELGLQQIEQGMNEGPHSKVEGAMVLAGALYSEERFAEFYAVLKEHITGPHPALLPAAAWSIGGCLCGGLFEEARKTALHAEADDGWRYLQEGRIALAKDSLKEAETAFSNAIQTGGGNRSNLAWAYYGRSLARKRDNLSGAADLKSSRDMDPIAFALAERQFLKKGSCR